MKGHCQRLCATLKLRLGRVGAGCLASRKTRSNEFERGTRYSAGQVRSDGAFRLNIPSLHLAKWLRHGELIRSGYDETLTVGPANLRFLIQGVIDKLKAGKKCGEIPWQLGPLTRKPGARPR